jgi:hypothetical protein
LNQYGWASLHLAVMKDDVLQAKLLSDRGANVNLLCEVNVIRSDSKMCFKLGS